jgi:NAD-dependent SIR2 family protein deacetylase
MLSIFTSFVSQGRKCDVCGSELYDTIINFGENLPKIPLQRAWEHTEKSDLMLVLGSSLTVSPACLMPEKVATNGMKLVICNLQKTPLDSLATIRIFAKCDDLMKLVMKKLGMNYSLLSFIRFFRFHSFHICI